MMNTGLVPTGLARSAVYRKVPLRVRCRLDRLILLRPAGCATEEAMARRLKLTEQYGISVAALKRYVRQLEAIARPVVASQLTAAIVGCLPPEFRRSVAVGGQTLLLGKVVQALSDRATESEAPTSQALSVADLAKLATVLRAMRPSEACRKHDGMSDSSELNGQQRGDAKQSSGDADALAEAVRAVYGLRWPLPASHSQEGRGEAGKTEHDALAG